MSPLRMSRRRPRSSSVLLVALGALTGLALGAVVADRVGGLDGLLKGKFGRSRKRGGGLDHDLALAAAADIADTIRTTRRPVILHSDSGDSSP